MVQVSRKEHPMPFDFDNTLVTQSNDFRVVTFFEDGGTVEGYVKIENPLTKTSDVYKIHQSHVRLLKEQFIRGRYVIVWSASGYHWAEAVVKALQLEEFVHLVMSKPIGYVDDKDIVSWIGNRIYVNDGER
jgi:hypothetical protein